MIWWNKSPTYSQTYQFPPGALFQNIYKFGLLLFNMTETLSSSVSEEDQIPENFFEGFHMSPVPILGDYHSSKDILGGIVFSIGHHPGQPYFIEEIHISEHLARRKAPLREISAITLEKDEDGYTNILSKENIDRAIVVNKGKVGRSNYQIYLGSTIYTLLQSATNLPQAYLSKMIVSKNPFGISDLEQGDILIVPRINGMGVNLETIDGILEEEVHTINGNSVDIERLSKGISIGNSGYLDIPFAFKFGSKPAKQIYDKIQQNDLWFGTSK